MAELNRLKYKCNIGESVTLTVQRENDDGDFEETEVKIILTEQK